MELSAVNEKEFKSANYIGTFSPSDPEWHELRSHGIGGSEIGTIMGLNPWESAYTLWAKKTGKISEDIDKNWSIRLGNAFEEPILRLFAEEHPELELFTCGTYAAKDMDFLHANPDALARHRTTGEWFVIEVKTARYPWESAPLHYIAQVQHYMDVLNIDRGYIVAVAGMNYVEYPLQADQFQQAAQRDVAFRFWQRVVNDQKPEWDGSESTYQTIRKMNPQIEDREVEVGEIGINLWNAQQRLDQAQAELNEYKSAVMDYMGYARTATVTVDGMEPVKVASRQMRGGSPALIIHRKAQ